MEIELKLLIEPQHADALIRHPLLARYAAEKPHEQQLTSIYFDTPDLEVRRRGGALRVRDVGGAWVQTYKFGGHVNAGMHHREEWETRVNGPALDIAALRALLADNHIHGTLLDDATLPNRMAPVFTTHIKRTIWELTLPHGTEVELALDQGTIEYTGNQHKGGRQENGASAISEVEMELKSGTPHEIFSLALALLDTIPMRIGNVSKAERGYAMCMAEAIPIVKAAPVKLTCHMTVAEAFDAIAGNCMQQAQGNEQGVIAGSDPESVHQMRVGLRRLRSALAMFRSIIALPAELRQEVNWLADELGAARDWEVLSLSTLDRMKSDGAAASATLLQVAAFTVAREKRAQAAAALQSVRHTRLMLQFSDWLLDGEWRRQARVQEPVAGFAEPLLERIERKLLKRGRRLRDGDAAARHRARIAAKKARYAVEFFRSLYPPKRAGRYLKSLSALQDELGRLNDIAVADRLLEELRLAQPEIADHASFARGYLAASQSLRNNAQDMHKRWKDFKAVKRL